MSKDPLFVIYDNRPCLTMTRCIEDRAIDDFVKRFRDSFEFRAEWDAYFLRPEKMPKCLLDALCGEDDGLFL